jgi:hypothetical protein
VRDFAAFVEAIAGSESSGDYAAKNRFGFLGRYQFGLARLSDLGLTERVPGTKRGFRWKAPLSEAAFLADHGLQDDTFCRHVADLHDVCMARFAAHLGRTACGVTVTMSGMIAVCHLLGPGGLADFLGGRDGADANGTKASTYMGRFAGYAIPGSAKTQGF